MNKNIPITVLLFLMLFTADSCQDKPKQEKAEETTVINWEAEIESEDEILGLGEKWTGDLVLTDDNIRFDADGPAKPMDLGFGSPSQDGEDGRAAAPDGGETGIEVADEDYRGLLGAVPAIEKYL